MKTLYREICIDSKVSLISVTSELSKGKSLLFAFLSILKVLAKVVSKVE